MTDTPENNGDMAVPSSISAIGFAFLYTFIAHTLEPHGRLVVLDQKTASCMTHLLIKVTCLSVPRELRHSAPGIFVSRGG
jgi:hypothetical protein